MLALLAFKHVCGLQMVGARKSGGADDSLSVPVDESWLNRSLTGVIRHYVPIAQIAVLEQPCSTRIGPELARDGAIAAELRGQLDVGAGLNEAST